MPTAQHSRVNPRQIFTLSIPVAAGYIPISIIYGYLLVQAGAPWWAPPLFSLIVYAGSAQFMAIPMMAAELSIQSIALATLVINLRHIFYGLSMHQYLPRQRWARFYMVWALTDESYAVLSTLPPDTPSAHRIQLLMLNHFWWLSGSILGATLGTQLQFTFSGLDFSLAALFAVLLVEQWRVNRHFLPLISALLCYLIALMFWPDNVLLISIAACALVSITPLADYEYRKKIHG